MHEDRRAHTRMNLEGIGFVTLHLKDSFEVFATLEDLSRAGLQVDLLPTGPDADPVPGDMVSLVDLPKGLRALLQDATGTVIWRAGSRCGIELRRPVGIDDDALKNRLRDNHLLPWSIWAA